jgi:hypothetical protein
MTHAAQEVHRRSGRIPSRLPITLRFTADDGTAEQVASTVDFSPHGLRIQTGTALKTGQSVSVVCPWGETPFGDYRVVWVRTAGAQRPTEAGLERMN